MAVTTVYVAWHMFGIDLETLCRPTATPRHRQHRFKTPDGPRTHSSKSLMAWPVGFNFRSFNKYSKSCKVNFPAEAFKTALFTRTTITNKIFPRTTRQLFLVHVEGDPGTVLCRGGWLQVLFCVGRVVAGIILCVRGGASGNLLEFACTDWWKPWNHRIQSVLVESPGPHAVPIRENKNAHRIVVGKAEGKKPLGISRCKWGIILKYTLKK